MKRFQLCLLAVFMLLVSNCVAGSGTAELTDGQKQTQLGTGGSDTDKKATPAIGGTTAGQKAKEGENTDKSGSTNTLTPQGDNKSGTPGASGLGKGSSPTETQAGVLPPQSSSSTAGATTKTQTGEKLSEAAPVVTDATADAKAKEDQPKSAPATEGATTKPQTGEKSSETSPVVAGTTTAPVAEEKPTEGNSDFASTSTQIPTDPAKGADSQASVKAGVLSFILSIGTVLAVFA